MSRCCERLSRLYRLEDWEDIRISSDFNYCPYCGKEIE